ncbi:MULTISPECIES: ketopantoate reductase family protein [Sporomusa]|uniref:2-dehydropantoate 2-reductase n=1 Tax=Sporomusa sphaeroides DSM 2875 TaxID=1337886 RepID=A0ABM9W1R9_9FIRM|nr:MULTISPECIES: 2-dehydropantoate 2-reductase [Sporomusa]MCM0761476.1 2-dehydropantoate 2-reductase [Sporomusa sphaeroides DSM 2875]OLS56520.1 2-dehydropantoate 2-reductase [Sporomusa sphaeroides DSM 2875]CVK19112.1 2-dehydropantoate 2-reductase [Sporomusa sphaeroides DSM 2875]HML32512.1 2-dehydropantoate 2-reductase [Sporomusa sphaeroides]
MKITVVGAGAIGGLFGSFLCKSGEEVTFVDINREHVAAIQAAGLIIERQSGTEVLTVKATTNIEEAGTPDLIIFSVKAYDNQQAAEDCLKIVGPDTIVLTVQNGVGNVETLSAVLGAGRIIAGTTAFGCTVLGPGRIKPSETGSISIGELDGRITPRLERVVAAFTKAGVEMHTSQNVDSLIWTKLLVNVGINPLGAITLLTNGQLLEHEETKSLQAAAVAEGAAVAKAKGIEFMTENILEHVRGVARGTYNNKASMRQDVERGSRTEVLAINGAIVAEGQKLGIPTPVNETLTKLVKAIEKRGKI